jgi:phosphatidate cytidylyltransferase
MTGKRVVSALVIAAILLAAVFLLPALGLVGVLSIVLLAAAWEWSALVAGPRPALQVGFILMTLVCSALLWLASRTEASLMACLALALWLWGVALLWLAFAPQRQSRAAVFIAGVVAISVAWMSLTRMTLDFAEGNRWVLYTLLIVWVADSGAYFVGRRWGKAKLVPRISPGKTWAGLWGGLIASAVLAVVVALVFHLPIVHLLLLTVVVAGYSVVGDLTESLCKRFAGRKDSGTLIPGHGGVLDRFDSLLAAAPCLLFGLTVIDGLAGTFAR